jgi:aminoglycoside/choline kinase family phosphotransferase
MGDMFPDSVESISPEWLSRVVSERYPNSVVESLEHLDAHSGTTGRVQLQVRWNQESQAPKRLFGKLAPTDAIQRQMVAATDMGRREARFYAEVAAELPIRVPATIWSGWSEADPNQYFMLLEDLSESGCHFPTSRDDNSLQSVEGMIDSLARLHGQYWQSPRFSKDLDWIDPPMRSEIGPALVRLGVETFGDRMPRAFHDLVDLYLNHTESVCDLLDSGAATLTHGDSHVANTFVDGDQIGLLDWACTCRAPGIRDVSYFLCNSIPTAMRSESQEALVRRYLKRLEEANGIVIPFDDAWRQYRRLATCSWIAATATAGAGDRMQPIDVGMRAVERANQAIIDLDTPGLIREELGL